MRRNKPLDVIVCPITKVLHTTSACRVYG
jgi:hypothetical protein